MNIAVVVSEILRVTNAMVSKASLPNFSLASKFDTGTVRITSLDELHRTLQGDIDGGREYQVHVFWH